MATDSLSSDLEKMNVQANGPTLYTSEKEGNDESGDGSLQKPFKTVMRALLAAEGAEPQPQIMVDGKEEAERYEKLAKAQLKKSHKIVCTGKKEI